MQQAKNEFSNTLVLAGIGLNLTPFIAPIITGAALYRTISIFLLKDSLKGCQ